MSAAVFPQISFWRDASLVLGGSILIAVAAQISVPLYGQGMVNPLADVVARAYNAIGTSVPATPVPITGQTFAVLLVGALLGSRLGFLSMLAYLAEGWVGLPVFSSFKSAWSPTAIVDVPWIVGPTAGYLWSLPVAALIVGWFAERGWDRNFLTTAIAMAFGNVAIYLCGVPFLSYFVGQNNGIALGLMPFIPGDVVKLLLAALLLPTGWVVLRRLGLLRR